MVGYRGDKGVGLQGKGSKTELDLCSAPEGGGSGGEYTQASPYGCRGKNRTDASWRPRCLFSSLCIPASSLTWGQWGGWHDPLKTVSSLWSLGTLSGSAVCGA